MNEELNKAVEYIVSEYDFINIFAYGDTLYIYNIHRHATWDWIGLSYIIFDVVPNNANIIDYKFIEKYKDKLDWNYFGFGAFPEKFCREYRGYIRELDFTCWTLIFWEHEKRKRERTSQWT